MRMSGFKKSLLVIFSFGIGAASGYFVCKKLLDKQYQDEIQEVREALLQYRTSLNPNTESVPKVEEPDSNIHVAEKIIDNNLYRPPKGRAYFNYSKPSMSELAKNIGLDDSYQTEEDEDIQEEEEEEFDEEQERELDILEEADEDARQRMDSSDPYVIDYDDFADAPDEYERQTLYFYSNDGYLCDEEDQLVEDEEKIVGREFEDVLNSEPVVFVRNDTLKTVYEIYRLDRSYQEDIKEIIETPQERELRRMARRKEVADILED